MTDEELAILCALIYDPVFSNANNVNSTVSEIVQRIEDTDNPPGMVSQRDYERLIQLASDPNSELGRLIVQSVNADRNAGANMAYFIDPVNNEGYVIFAGTEKDEWKYDIEGAINPDPANKVAMKQWFDSLGITSPVTVAGHSDGGNDAEYLTVVVGDRIKRCLAIDAQGFSNAFTAKYQNLIPQASVKITSINHYRDFVSPLLTSIAGKEVFIEGGTGAIPHVLTEIFARDRNGTIIAEFGSLGAREPFMDMLHDFSTNYLVQSLSPNEIMLFSLFIQDIFDNNISLDSVLSNLPQIARVLLEFSHYLTSLKVSDPERYEAYRISFISIFFGGNELLGGMAWDTLRALIGSPPVLVAASQSDTSFAARAGTERDFTEATKEHLLSLVREAEKTISPVTDYLHDNLILRPAEALGVLGLFADADEYQRRLFDLNNTSAEQLITIFNNVAAADSEYASKFASNTDRLLDTRKSIVGIMQPVYEKSMYSSTTSSITDREISDYYQAQEQAEYYWTHLEGAFDASVLGAEAIASGRVWLDAETGTLQCDGSVEGRAYLAQLRAQGTFRIGDLVFDAEGKVFIGAEAWARGEMEFGPDGYRLAADAGGCVGARIDQSVNAMIGDSIGLGLSSSLAAGAEATGSASLYGKPSAGEFGLSANVKAFAGAEVTVTPSASTGPVGAACEMSVQAGVGFSAGGSVDYQEGVFKAELDLGASLGLGFSVKPSISVDIGAIVNGAEAVWSGVSSLVQWW